MTVSEMLLIGAVAVSATVFSASVASATERPEVVVELFTSQGCSSCPPANANLIKLSKQPGVLALSFSVTYWDYLGWKDIFGKQEYTDRQAIYEPGLGKSGPFTPQMVFNGSSTAIGYDLGEARSMVSDAAKLDGPEISLSGKLAEIGANQASKRPADVWLVRYEPGIEKVPVARGENTGATLSHVHVVRALERLGSWDGARVSYDLPPAAKGLRTAVLVQAVNGGPLLSAATE
jgi:hypothetical protein